MKRRLDPRALAARVWDPHWARKAWVWASALAKDRLLQELPDGKHFPGGGRARGAQVQAEQPQWTLVWRFSLDLPTGLVPGLGWALLSDLQPDSAPKQPIRSPATRL